MKATIYLIVDRNGVKRMTKTLPDVNRFETPIRVQVTVDEKAFRTPVLEKEIYVDDWREGIDLADVEFKGAAITEAEAEMIRNSRLAEMQRVLTELGYKVEAPTNKEKS